MYEYKIIEDSDNVSTALSVRLNVAAQEGWRVISTISAANATQSPPYARVLLERRKPVGAQTGRMDCSKPNLSQVPR